jgi:hypothetical protein
MANIHTITTAVGSMSVTTQLWVYKCPNCQKNIVSYVHTLSTNSGNMIIMGDAIIFVNAMLETP